MPSELFDWLDTLRIDIQHMRQIIDTQQKTLVAEKETKIRELKSLLQEEAETSVETPPNVMIAFLMASLRRVYNADQLAKAHWQLGELEQTIEQFDDMPYRWRKPGS